MRRRRCLPPRHPLLRVLPQHDRPFGHRTGTVTAASDGNVIQRGVCLHRLRPHARRDGRLRRFRRGNDVLPAEVQLVAGDDVGGDVEGLGQLGQGHERVRLVLLEERPRADQVAPQGLDGAVATPEQRRQHLRHQGDEDAPLHLPLLPPVAPLHPCPHQRQRYRRHGEVGRGDVQQPADQARRLGLGRRAQLHQQLGDVPELRTLDRPPRHLVGVREGLGEPLLHRRGTQRHHHQQLHATDAREHALVVVAVVLPDRPLRVGGLDDPQPRGFHRHQPVRRARAREHVAREQDPVEGRFLARHAHLGQRQAHVGMQRKRRVQRRRAFRQVQHRRPVVQEDKHARRRQLLARHAQQLRGALGLQLLRGPPRLPVHLGGGDLRAVHAVLVGPMRGLTQLRLHVHGAGAHLDLHVGPQRHVPHVLVQRPVAVVLRALDVVLEPMLGRHPPGHAPELPDEVVADGVAPFRVRFLGLPFPFDARVVDDDPHAQRVADLVHRGQVFPHHLQIELVLVLDAVNQLALGPLRLEVRVPLHDVLDRIERLVVRLVRGDLRVLGALEHVRVDEFEREVLRKKKKV